MARWSAPALGAEGLQAHCGPRPLLAAPSPTRSRLFLLLHSRTVGLGSPLLLGCARPAPALWFLAAGFLPRCLRCTPPPARSEPSLECHRPREATGPALPTPAPVLSFLKAHPFPHALQSSMWSFCPGCQTHEHRAPAPGVRLAPGGRWRHCVKGWGALTERWVKSQVWAALPSHQRSSLSGPSPGWSFHTLLPAASCPQGKNPAVQHPRDSISLDAGPRLAPHGASPAWLLLTSLQHWGARHQDGAGRRTCFQFWVRAQM